jgi:hypothetical protein
MMILRERRARDAMTDSNGPPGEHPRELQRILRCGKCGRTVTCQPSEMLAYTLTGWPKCCSETMTLFIEAKVPGRLE